MESALHIKELADTIEDSIVATDIGKLPAVGLVGTAVGVPNVSPGLTQISSVSGVTHKRLTNFILQETQQNALTVGGITYDLTGPINGGSGTIKGLEVGYQQFFRSLPGLLRGLGAEVSYTYTDAAAPTAAVGVSTTLPGLSRNSYNLIGIYEKGPMSFRLAYNWRSQFHTTIYKRLERAARGQSDLYQTVRMARCLVGVQCERLALAVRARREPAADAHHGILRRPDSAAVADDR